MRREFSRIGAATGLAMAIATSSGATGPAAVVPSCGHVEELAAAKRALQEGHEKEALRHLQNADGLLSRCQRDEKSVDPDGSGDQPGAVDVGRTEAPPTSLVQPIDSA